nr:beta-propeller domain-containing protein [Clostridiales bacterium]
LYYTPYYAKDTFTAIYDISDINNICLIKQYCQSGQYVSSRITNDNIYCITQYYVDLSDKNYKDNCIPKTSDEKGKKTVEAGNIAIIPDTDSPVYTVISSCGTDGKSQVYSDAILGYTNQTYATSENLFLLSGDYDDKNDISKTNIYKFGFTDQGAKFEAEASVPGYINNQFSLDYENGYLRIATTYDRIISDGKVKELDGESNALFILDKNLKTVGELDNLAENEIIKSARYIGDYAYVVTFRQTDPLFVIDLSDPKKPAVVGELSIPGFSSYLHPISETLMVGAGSDGDEENVNEDCKVSLFDISDKSNPKEISKLTVASKEDAYVFTEIGYNHKVFISLPGNEFAIPFSQDSYYENNDGQYMMESMYIRYGIVDNQLKEIARYNLADESTAQGGTYIGDTFFVLSDGYSENDGYFAKISSFSLTSNKAVDTLVISENG